MSNNANFRHTFENNKTTAEMKYGTQRKDKSLKRPRSTSPDVSKNKSSLKILLRYMEDLQRQRQNALHEKRKMFYANSRNQNTLPVSKNIRIVVGLKNGQVNSINNQIRAALNLKKDTVNLEDWTKLSQNQQQLIVKEIKKTFDNRRTNEELISAYNTFKGHSKYFDNEYDRLRKKKSNDVSKFRLLQEQSKIELKILSRIHEILFSNPSLVFNIPKYMLPKLNFHYSNKKDEFGHLFYHPNHSLFRNPKAIRTITKELKNDRERWFKVVQRLQSINPGSHRDGGSFGAIAMGQEKQLTEKIKGVSGGIRIFEGNARQFNRILKKIREQVTIYHTVAYSKLNNVFKNIQEFKQSSIGVFGQAFWHTDPMFQWVGTDYLHKVTERGPTPKVAALFTMKVPLNEYIKWTRSTNNYNKNATGTGTTLLVDPFVFRVEEKQDRNNFNHNWNVPVHFKIQWLSGTNL